MHDQLVLRVRLQDMSGQDVATSIQVVVPPGLDEHQIKAYMIGKIANELSRYAIDEAYSLLIARSEFAKKV